MARICSCLSTLLIRTRDTWIDIDAVVKNAFYKFTSASTGTPSDGLGKDSESTASIIQAFHAAARQQNDEKSGADWELDEIIVSNDHSEADHSQSATDSGHKAQRTTSSEKGTTSHGGSLRRNFDRQDSRASESVYSSWMRGRLWPYVITFFNPHFEDPGVFRVNAARASYLFLFVVREMDYQKQEWVRYFFS